MTTIDLTAPELEALIEALDEYRYRDLHPHVREKLQLAYDGEVVYNPTAAIGCFLTIVAIFCVSTLLIVLTIAASRAIL